jgi:hypothetical protein
LTAKWRPWRQLFFSVGNPIIFYTTLMLLKV